MNIFIKKRVGIMKSFIAFIFLFTTLGVSAELNSSYELSAEKIASIESRVDSMSYNDLIKSQNSLLKEKSQLEASYQSEAGAAGSASVGVRLAEIVAELSAIQKALSVVAGAAIVGNITADKYNDEIPPVITLNGASSVTVELGGTYVEAGATAEDAYHGTTTVTVSGNVDANTVGTYTVTYTATDLDNNTATATRTVSVVDTTAPVITSSSTFVAPENQTAIGTVTATDLDSVTFSVSGSDLSITSSGVLTFVVAPDNENYSTITATVTATDASSNATTQQITVNVSDVDDEAPTFTSANTFTAAENQTTIGYVIASDVDTDDSNITFSVSGDSRVTIESAGNGAITSGGTAALLSFTAAPDNENYTTAVVTVTATDLAGNSSSQTVTVNVSDVDDELHQLLHLLHLLLKKIKQLLDM